MDTDRDAKDDLLGRHLFTHEAYISVFRNHPDIVYMLDSEGFFLDCNDSASAHFGYTRDEWVNARVGFLTCPEDKGKLLHAFKQALTGVSQQIELTCQHRNGNRLHIELTLVPAYVEGQVVGVYGFGKDTSRRFEMQNELLRNQIRMNHAQEIANFGIWEYDLETREVTVSEQMQAMFGFTENTENMEEYYARVHPEDIGRVIKIHKEENLQERALTELRVIRPDGIIRTLLSHWHSFRNEYGSPTRVYGVFQDITDRKVVEEELRESEAKYKLITENTNDLIRIIDPQGTILYVSPSHRRVLGLNDVRMVGTSALDYIYPEDREIARQALSNLLRVKTDHQVRYRCMHSNGLLLHVECLMTPILGEDGEVETIVIVSRDITEQVRIETELRESEDRYYRLQTSLDGISRDLYGVLNITQIEGRLVREVREVLRTSAVSIVQVVDKGSLVTRQGSLDVMQALAEDIMDQTDSPVCEIVQTPSGYLVKLRESREPYFLCISGKPWTLSITAKQVWLKTITRYISALYDNFRLIDELTKEVEKMAGKQAAPAWLLRLLFSLSENERKRLSQDLHDSALQDQILCYRKLHELSTDESVPMELREALGLIAEGLLDVIYQIRITCNELRPPLLKEEGLISSLHALFEFLQRRTDYQIEFNVSNVSYDLTDDVSIGLYRIVQELLANATKHSKATIVSFTLSKEDDGIRMIYHDDGIGMDLAKLNDCSFESMGVYGMKQRVHSMDGTISIDSSPNQGVYVHITVPSSPKAADLRCHN